MNSTDRISRTKVIKDYISDINERLEGISNISSELYNGGYNSGYIDGSKNACDSKYQKAEELYKSIKRTIKFSAKTKEKIFGYSDIVSILLKNTSQEFIEKLNKYENAVKEEKEEVSEEKDYEPKIGDSVYITKVQDCNGINVFPIGTIGEIVEIEDTTYLQYLIKDENNILEYWLSRDMFKVLK